MRWSINKLRKANDQLLYISSRGIAGFLAVGFSVVYSRALGVEKRSILSFILVISLVMSILIISPISLNYRKRNLNHDSSKELHIAYVLLSSFLSAFTTLIVIFIVWAYNKQVVPIPRNLYIAIGIYSLFSTLAFSLQDVLVATHKIRTSAVFDVLTVILQFLTYVLLYDFNKTSLVVTVLLALSIPYLITSFAIYTLVFNLYPWPQTSVIKSIFSGMQKSALVTLSIAFLDRYDKLVIAFLLPLPFLGKYAVISGFVALVRFLPESIARSLFFPQRIKSHISQQRSTHIMVFFGVLAAPFLTQELIKLLLGERWLVSTVFIFSIYLQEVFRGYFQVLLNKVIIAGFDRVASVASLGTVTAGILLVPLSVMHLNVYGPPVVMALAYGTASLWIRSHYE